MKYTTSSSPQLQIPLNVLLADDDIDDRYFFGMALEKISIPTRLETVGNGEQLMKHLLVNSEKLPDVLFLDLNMPRKNGLQCLSEIKNHQKLNGLPVIIYSTHMHEKDAGTVYKKGAHYYIRKTDMIELVKVLNTILPLMIENKFVRTTQDKFVFS